MSRFDRPSGPTGLAPGARPPAARATRLRLRWGEFAVSAALTLILIFFGAQNAMAGGVFGWTMMALGAGCGVWARLAFLRAYAGQRRDDPGVVVVEERRITYLGPETGGVLSIDALRAVDVESGPNATWILREAGGPTLRIPAGARGVRELPEALAALPEFSEARALKAIAAEGAAMHAVWRRAAPAGGAALAAS